MKTRPNMHDTKTTCSCEHPLLMDESAVGMGVNCLKCGRSAEGSLTSDERRTLRDDQRAGRPRREGIKT